MNDARLISLLNRWKSTRDRITSRTRAPLDMTSPQSEFLRALAEHCNELQDVLPVMNLAELEALSELASSLLAGRRMQDQQAANLYKRPINGVQ